MGVCRGCGAYTQPRNGKGDAYAYCKRCHPGAIERRWTRELVISAMLGWRERYGRWPSSYDWSRTHARRRGEQALQRLADGQWPAASVVSVVFGSWAVARQAAAWKTRGEGRPGGPYDRGPTYVTDVRAGLTNQWEPWQRLIDSIGPYYGAQLFTARAGERRATHVDEDLETVAAEGRRVAGSLDEEGARLMVALTEGRERQSRLAADLQREAELMRRHRRWALAPRRAAGAGRCGRASRSGRGAPTAGGSSVRAAAPARLQRPASVSVV